MVRHFLEDLLRMGSLSGFPEAGPVSCDEDEAANQRLPGVPG